MKIKFQLLISIVLSLGSFAFGQSIPRYNPKNLNFKVPIELRGVFADTVNQQGDFYTYNYNGLNFLDKPVILPSLALGFKGTTDFENPFGVIASLWYGYQTANIELLKSLTTEEGLKKLESQDYFNQVNQNLAEVREIDTIMLLAAFDVGSGVMVFTKNKKYGIERNYLERINGRYYIVPPTQRQYDPMIQNFVLYLFYNPQPYRELQNISAPDSVLISEKINFSAQVSKLGHFVVLARPKIGESIFANVEDNGSVDSNNDVRKIEFPITFGYFLPKGENVIYAVESNFPVLFVTQTLLDSAVIIKVKVKK